LDPRNFPLPTVYIDDFVGVSNKLETLPMAFAIRKAFGHEIVLDWPELDSFRVEDTRRGGVHVLARIGAIRVRCCDDRLFNSLRRKKIILRSLDGPAYRLDPIYLDVASRIRLDRVLAGDIRSFFSRIGDRPVVGVHIRGGDYQPSGGDIYDPLQVEWPAVPLWWYEHVMGTIVRQRKDACFFLSATGDPASYTALRKNFDVVSLDVENPYAYKGADHGSKVHPVADLFALACCPLILATPVSGYSHWAANVLGGPADCLVPLAGATRSAPKTGLLQLYGMRLPVWRAFGRNTRNTKVASERLEGINLARRASCEWL
jgi:hypothetical protein